MWNLLKQTGTSWLDHKDARLGAALAYYSIFSVGPLILIAIAVAGLWFGEDAVRGQVSGQIQDLLGTSGAQAVQSMLAGAARLARRPIRNGRRQTIGDKSSWALVVWDRRPRWTAKRRASA